MHVFATFDRYPTPSGVYDEMFDGEAVRAAYSRIHGRVTALSPEELRARADFLARSYVDQGVTFDIGAKSSRSRSTSFRGSSTPRPGRSSSRASSSG